MEDMFKAKRFAIFTSKNNIMEFVFFEDERAAWEHLETKWIMRGKRIPYSLRRDFYVRKVDVEVYTDA